MATKTWIGGSENHEYEWDYEDNWDGGLPGENDIAVFADGYLAQCLSGPLSPTTIAGLVVSGAGAVYADFGNLLVSGDVNISAVSYIIGLTVLGHTSITGGTELFGGTFPSINVETTATVFIQCGTYGHLHIRAPGCGVWGTGLGNLSTVQSIDADGIYNSGYLSVQGTARVVNGNFIECSEFHGDTEITNCSVYGVDGLKFYANAVLRDMTGAAIYTYGDGHVQCIGCVFTALVVEGLLTTLVNTSFNDYLIIPAGNPPRRKTVRWIGGSELRLETCEYADIEFSTPCTIGWVGYGTPGNSTFKLMRPEATLTWRDVPIIPAYMKGEPVLVGA